MSRGPRAELAEKIAGEVALSDDPGATLRKWRTDFEVPQTALADELDVSPSVISDYESGRRGNPGVDVVRRIIAALLDVDERHGADHIRRYARVLLAGFDSDVVYDLREYAANIPVERLHEATGATGLVAGDRDTIAGHTVLDSVEVIRRFSSEEFYSLYGESTNRALVFTNVTDGEGAMVALRVVQFTPHAVVLHGIGETDLWEHAAELARIEGFALALTEMPLDGVLDRLRELP